MPLIEAKNLQKTYFNDGVETPAIRGVSFSIEKGEFVAIMGPSGSGKSTLLHMLGFLDRNTGGRYELSGKTISDYQSSELAHVRNKKMGFVFQAFNLLPRTSVLDNVKLPLIYSDIPESQWDERARAAIESVDLSHRLAHESSQLSGGEKQRVAIARALVTAPDIIFADEPTGNLDTKSGDKIMEALQELHAKEEHTIVVITHDRETAKYADRIIQLRDGVIERDEKV